MNAVSTDMIAMVTPPVSTFTTASIADVIMGSRETEGSSVTARASIHVSLDTAVDHQTSSASVILVGRVSAVTSAVGATITAPVTMVWDCVMNAKSGLSVHTASTAYQVAMEMQPRPLAAWSVTVTVMVMHPWVTATGRRVSVTAPVTPWGIIVNCVKKGSLGNHRMVDSVIRSAMEDLS